MKFESDMAIEIAELQSMRQSGVKIHFWELYREFNRQDLPSLLRKRTEDSKFFAQRSKKRLEQLQEAEKNGVLFMK